MRRLFDICVALALLAILALPMLAIALAVALDSPGPVIFKQQRVGRDRKLFWMYKFRTMRVGTPEVATHLMTDLEKYITRVGRFLRKTSLDELPQLFNVLKGDMSIIGPRPALYNQYDLIEMRERAGVNRLRPGITGWAQVNGRDELSLEEKTRYDAEYLRRQSFLLDLKILWLTLRDAGRGKGVRA